MHEILLGSLLTLVLLNDFQEEFVSNTQRNLVVCSIASSVFIYISFITAG